MSGPDISGSGFMGLAFETTSGTYVAPTKFFPITGETLAFTPANTFRRPIRQTVDQVGMVAGNISVTGTVTMEALDDVMVYWLYAMRTNIVRAGTGPFTYTSTPVGGVIANRTLSLTVVRAGTVFGYVGCVVSKLTLTINNDYLEAQLDIVGTNESNQAMVTPTWGTSAPFGPGMWNVAIPTTSQVFDLDTFSFSIDEVFAAQYRLKNTGPNQGRGAQFVAAGERTIQMTATRDFIDRSDYDNFQNNVSQSITITATNPTTNTSISFVMPVAFKNAYSVPLAAQGDLVRANITYDTTIDATGKAAQIVVVTNENIS